MCVIYVWQKITIFSKSIAQSGYMGNNKDKEKIIKQCSVESTLWTLQAELNRQ